MKYTKKLLSIRYSKLFPFNYFKCRKLPDVFNDVKKESHKCCPVCGNDSSYLLSEVDRIGTLCNTVACKKCFFVFNDTYTVEPSEPLDKFFAACWRDGESSFHNRTKLGSFSWLRFNYLILKLKEKFSKVNSVLEIGCGDGCNLYPYHLIGKEVLGSDISDKYFTVAQSYGLNLTNEPLSSIKKNKYDLVLLVHSFEYIQNLDSAVLTVYELLSDDGLVYVELPGIQYMNSMNCHQKSEDGFNSGNNFLNYIQYGHNYHFDLEHLIEIWERNGFEFVDGDQWIRAIFKKSEKERDSTKEREYVNIVSYLKDVESDYLSISGILKKINRILIKALT